MTDNSLRAEFAQFIGSETLYQHVAGLRYTEGVQYLANGPGRTG